MNCKIIARGLFLLFLVSLLAQNALAADGDSMTAAEIAILVMSAVITGFALLFFLGSAQQLGVSRGGWELQ